MISSSAKTTSPTKKMETTSHGYYVKSPTLTACPNDFLADNHDDEEDGEDISKYAMVFKDAALGRNLWKRCHVSAHFPYAASVINKGKDREYVQIQLEGGIAFGMGEHPTMRLA
jgi:ribosomal protein L11 methylase PrmA